MGAFEFESRLRAAFSLDDPQGPFRLLAHPSRSAGGWFFLGTGPSRFDRSPPICDLGKRASPIRLMMESPIRRCRRRRALVTPRRPFREAGRQAAAVVLARPSLLPFNLNSRTLQSKPETRPSTSITPCAGALAPLNRRAVDHVGAAPGVELAPATVKNGPMGPSRILRPRTTRGSA
jgi:hypothetical protein